MLGKNVDYSIIFHGTRELPQGGLPLELIGELRGFQQRLGLESGGGSSDAFGAFAIDVPRGVSIPEGELAQFTTTMKERFGFELRERR